MKYIRIFGKYFEILLLCLGSLAIYICFPAFNTTNFIIFVVWGFILGFLILAKIVFVETEIEKLIDFKMWVRIILLFITTSALIWGKVFGDNISLKAFVEAFSLEYLKSLDGVPYVLGAVLIFYTVHNFSQLLEIFEDKYFENRFEAQKNKN